MTDNFIRGATIQWNATFYNPLNALYTPDGANVDIVYYANEIRTTLTIPMTINGSSGYAAWNSEVADQGMVEWFMNTVGTIKSPAQGVFNLTANDANPNPSPAP